MSYSAQEAEQQIRFCTSSNGARIAYAVLGAGPPLIKAGNPLTHLSSDRQSPVWRHWLASLAQHHTFIRYDERGCGLSDWDIDEFSTNAWVSDLEAVVNHTNSQRFALLGYLKVRQLRSPTPFVTQNE